MYNILHLDFNECESNPCIHGTCEDSIGTYLCECEAGYTGHSCEVGKDLSQFWYCYATKKTTLCCGP